MMLQSLTTNNTVTILNAFVKNGNSKSFNESEWKVVLYPEVNPAAISNFEVGLWRCLVILAALTIFLRILSLFFLKVFLSKFQ